MRLRKCLGIVTSIVALELVLGMGLDRVVADCNNLRLAPKSYCLVDEESQNDCSEYDSLECPMPPITPANCNNSPVAYRVGNKVYWDCTSVNGYQFDCTLTGPPDICYRELVCWWSGAGGCTYSSTPCGSHTEVTAVQNVCDGE